MTFKVAALGIVNAGKSSLLSALVDEEGAFKSGDVPRVTRCVQRRQTGGIEWVDTPGLDADAGDTALALAAAQHADSILWCHNVRTGELRPPELAALESRVVRSGSMLWRSSIVLTHIDDVADESIVREVSAAVAAQLKNIFPVPFLVLGAPHRDGGKARPMNYVASQRYWRGSALRGPARERLLRNSGVPQLRNFLESLSRKVRAA